MSAFIRPFVLFLAISTAVAAPAKRDSPCEAISQRKAWHTYTASEKAAYINAELCLQSIPATLGLPGAETRFDELVVAHQVQAEVVHGVGAFLPFHRLHMHAHEYLLQTECGYTGTQPYWDEVRDAGNFTSSIVFDVATFGGDGAGTTDCVVDGPFANYTLHVGPSHENTAHCLTRNISDRSSSPHAGGHGGVGGEMLNPISSPVDPLFYLHHTQLDRIWATWQAMDSPARLTDISGPITQSNGFPELQTRDGDPGNETTLAHVLNMYGIIPNQTIADVMDTTGGYLCYEYV
ncbi:Di-copper centre-containing protein [Cadophora sp. DSE1049]|nr:Di-copper centre-containing protein [Cadophora sp. DSE1049]